MWSQFYYLLKGVVYLPWHFKVLTRYIGQLYTIADSLGRPLKWQWDDGATCTHKDWQSLLFATFENVIPVEANVGAKCGSNARYN